MNEIPEQIWYGMCTYWTDDWDALTPTPENKGIPSCPECGSVGFQMTVQEWNQGIATLDKDSPGYADFINELKGKCHGKTTTLAELWEIQKGVLAEAASEEEEE